MIDRRNLLGLIAAAPAVAPVDARATLERAVERAEVGGFAPEGACQTLTCAPHSHMVTVNVSGDTAAAQQAIAAVRAELGRLSGATGAPIAPMTDRFVNAAGELEPFWAEHNGIRYTPDGAGYPIEHSHALDFDTYAGLEDGAGI